MFCSYVYLVRGVGGHSRVSEKGRARAPRCPSDFLSSNVDGKEVLQPGPSAKKSRLFSQKQGKAYHGPRHNQSSH